MTQAGVVAIGVDTPPSAPAQGQAWIVGAAPAGAWAGHGNAIAGWTAGGWRFITPCEGMNVWSEADSCDATFAAGQWHVGRLAGASVAIGGVQVVGARRAAINAPVGGGVIDTEARAILSAVLGALRGHGLIAP